MDDFDFDETILGEPASGKNSRRIVSIGGKLRLIKSEKALAYTKMFKGIFASGEEIPHSIKKDPQKIIDWARNPKGRERAREVLDKAAEGGAGLFGATKEDLESLGVEMRGAGTVSLQDAVKKKGGSLNMQDLMKLSGID